jgi:hypothetical protein
LDQLLAMRPVRAVLLFTTALMGLYGPSARASGPVRLEILSLHPGMTAPEALAQLHSQGIDGAAIVEHRQACTPAQAGSCLATIDARTRDGRLRIVLVEAAPEAPAAQDVVFRIDYRITGRGAGDAGAVRAAAIDWYGRPTSVATTAWCGRLDIATGACAAGQPILRVEAVPDAAALLTLSDESLVVPGSAPESAKGSPHDLHKIVR